MRLKLFEEFANSIPTIPGLILDVLELGNRVEKYDELKSNKMYWIPIGDNLVLTPIRIYKRVTNRNKDFTLDIKIFEKSEKVSLEVVSSPDDYTYDIHLIAALTDTGTGDKGGFEGVGRNSFDSKQVEKLIKQGIYHYTAPKLEISDDVASVILDAIHVDEIKKISKNELALKRFLYAIQNIDIKMLKDILEGYMLSAHQRKLHTEFFNMIFNKNITDEKAVQDFLYTHRGTVTGKKFGF
jgi:hypothetical protein